jgi:hypothetical protein
LVSSRRDGPIGATPSSWRVVGAARDLQIEAGAEGAMRAAEHAGARRIIGIECGESVGELLRHRRIDRVPRLAPVDDDSGDGSVLLDADRHGCLRCGIRRKHQSTA